MRTSGDHKNLFTIFSVTFLTLCSLVWPSGLGLADEQRTNRIIENPVSNGDLRLKVNVGGSKTEVLTVDGPTGFVGVKTTAPTVALEVNGAEKVSGDLTVDTTTLAVDSTNNRVGIGIAAPAQPLHVKTSTGSGITADTSSVAVLEAVANTRLQLSASSGDQYVLFGASGANDRGAIGYLSGDNLVLNTSSAERMRIDSAGRFGLRTNTNVYRTTDGGSDITSEIILDQSAGSANGLSTSVDTTGGLVFLQKNDAPSSRRIARAAIVGLVDTSNTDSTEDGQLIFKTKPAGSAYVQTMALSSTGVATIGPTAAVGGTTFAGPLIVGKTDGSTVPAGYIGRLETATISQTSATTSEADVTGASLTLPAGLWHIFYSVTADYATGAGIGNNGYIQVVITNSSNTHIGKTERIIVAVTGVAVSNEVDGCLAASTVVNVSASTTYKLRLKRVDISGTGTGAVEVSSGNFDGTFYAVRI